MKKKDGLTRREETDNWLLAYRRLTVAPNARRPIVSNQGGQNVQGNQA